MIEEKDGNFTIGPSNQEVWRNMEDLVNKGLVKSIGVSNFNVQSILEVLSYAKIRPVCNQFELHPYINQTELIKVCQRFGITVVAYNSLARGEYSKQYQNQFDLLNDKIILSLAEKYKKTPGQIILNWAASQDIVVIPATSKGERLTENLETLTFKMNENDIQLITSLNKSNFRFNKTFNDPEFYFIDVHA